MCGITANMDFAMGEIASSLRVVHLTRAILQGVIPLTILAMNMLPEAISLGRCSSK